MNACRRETSVDSITTSHAASRPKTSGPSPTWYSRPSARLTSRPLVIGPAGCATGLGDTADRRVFRGVASATWVAPMRLSSTTTSSTVPSCTLSPCSSGTGSAPSRTPLTITTASGSARRIAAPPRVDCTSAWLSRTPAPSRRTAATGEDPRTVSPAASGQRRPPNSSWIIGLDRYTCGGRKTYPAAGQRRKEATASRRRSRRRAFLGAAVCPSSCSR